MHRRRSCNCSKQQENYRQIHILLHILMKSWGWLYRILIMIGVTHFSLPSRSGRRDVWQEESIMPVLWIYAAVTEAASTLPVWIIQFFNPEACSSWFFTLHACRIAPGMPFRLDQLCLSADKHLQGLSAGWPKDSSSRPGGLPCFLVYSSYFQLPDIKSKTWQLPRKPFSMSIPYRNINF